jgi:hypothetical protein
MTEHEFRTGTPDPARSDVITLDETIPPLLWMRKPVPVMALRFLDIAAPAMIRFDRDNLPEWIEQAVEAPQGEPGAIWIEWEWPGKEPGDAARLILHGPTAIEIVEPGSWIVGDADGIRAYSDEEFRAAHETIVSDPPLNPQEKTMRPHVERMQSEWTELHERIAKLADFLNTSIYANLDLVDQQLLHGQHAAMTAYGCILTQRLDRANQSENNQDAGMLSGGAMTIGEAGGFKLNDPAIDEQYDDQPTNIMSGYGERYAESVERARRPQD